MPQLPEISALCSIPLLQGLTAEQLLHIAALLHVVRFPRNASIMSTEQPSDGAYIVWTGMVKVHVEQADGSDVVLAVFGPHQLIGEMGLIERVERSATVVTLKPSTLLWMSRDAFQECMETMPILTVNLVQILARRLRLAAAQIQSISTQDVKGRLARLLIGFAREYSQPCGDGAGSIPLPLTQSDLGNMIGASRQRVSETLSAYKRAGIISANHGNLVVHDMAALEQIAASLAASR